MSTRFCAMWLAGIVGLLVAVGLFNVAIDPWLVFGAPRVAGVNARKPDTDTHTRLSKDYLLGRAQPTGLMLGDSKVDIGLDPVSPSWPDDARPVFNLGLPGATIRESLTRLRWALPDHPIKRVLMLVELRELMGAAIVPADGDGSGGRWAEMAQAALSLDALSASIQTVLAQRQAYPVDMTDAGSTSENVFRDVVRTDGYDTLFVQKDKVTFLVLDKFGAALAARPDAPFAGLAEVAGIVKLCRERGIVLDLAIAPGHADALDSYRAAGLWPRYEAAKRALTAVAAESDTPLWDFSGYDAYSTEAVPAAGDRRSQMRWFWEPTHFTKALGEVLLATVYRGGADYGVRLTPATFEARLLAQREAQRVYAGEATGWQSRLQRAGRSPP